MPRPAPAPAPVLPVRPVQVQRGLSLKPKDAVDPYRSGALVPDLVGIQQLTIWCPGCDKSLMVTDAWLTPHHLCIEGVCHWCSNRIGDKPGVYKRVAIRLRQED